MFALLGVDLAKAVVRELVHEAVQHLGRAAAINREPVIQSEQINVKYLNKCYN